MPLPSCGCSSTPRERRKSNLAGIASLVERPAIRTLNRRAGLDDKSRAVMHYRRRRKKVISRSDIGGSTSVADEVQRRRGDEQREVQGSPSSRQLRGISREALIRVRRWPNRCIRTDGRRFLSSAVLHVARAFRGA